MRKSLFEKIKEEKINIIEEIQKIKILTDNIDLENFLYNSFKVSAFNFKFVSYNDAFDSIIDPNLVPYEQQLWQTNYYNHENNQFGIKLDSFLDLSEFLLTLVQFYQKSSFNKDEVSQLSNLILHDLKILGYEPIIIEKDKYVKVKLKDPVADAVALNQSESVRDKIDNYLMLRAGDVELKRKEIKSLADDVETICKKTKNIHELKQFIQCTRHTKNEPKPEFPFYYEDEEKWLDNIFRMILSALSYNETKQIVAAIDKLEKEKNPNK